MKQRVTSRWPASAFFLAAPCLLFCVVDSSPAQPAEKPTDARHATTSADEPALSSLGCDPTPAGLEFSLTLGSQNDSDPNQPVFLIKGKGISLPQTGAGSGRFFRTLDPQGPDRAGHLEFRVNTTSLPLQPNGLLDYRRMPNCNAMIDVEYQDVVDEKNCSSCDDISSACRPRLYTRLDFGAEPESEWWTIIGGFGGFGNSAWKTERFFLEATPWQMLRALPEGRPRSTGPRRFQFRIAYPEPKSGHAPLPISRITIRFVDKACFDKLREADRAARTLVRREYVEPRTLDPHDYPGRSYVVYRRNYLRKIYPNTVPDPTEIMNDTVPLEVFEIRGETEPVTFAIYAFADLQDVQVRTGPLRRQDGRSPNKDEVTEIQSGNVRIHRVVSADKRWAYGRDPYYGLQPWYLDVDQPFIVPAGKSRQIWALIDVPANAAPGTYAGEINISCAGGSPGSPGPHRLPLILKVYDLALAEPDAPAYLCNSPYTPGLRYAGSPQLAARDIAALGIRSVNTWMCPKWDPGAQRGSTGQLPTTVRFPESAIEELEGLASAGILNGKLYCFVSDNRLALWNALCRDERGMPVPLCTRTCPEFDNAYTHILSAYKEFYGGHGVQPAVSFVDEPGDNAERRREANHMNRLARKAGLNTQVSYYYPACEKPLAGWRFSYSQPAGGVHVTPPPWRQGGRHEDPAHLVAYWNFAQPGSTQPDLSGHGNTGTLHGACAADGGELKLENEKAYMWVNDSPTLNLTRQGTISLWFRPDEYTLSCMAPVIRKGNPNGNEVNYGLFLGGVDPQCGQQGLAGLLQARASVAGQAFPVSGDTRITRTGLRNWYNVTWVYDAAVGGTMYVNGTPFFTPTNGPLSTDHFGLVCGAFKGAMAEIAILDRAATENEISDLIQSATDASYTHNQLVLALTLPPGKTPPSTTMTFSLGDTVRGPAGLETTKRLEVNGETIWEGSRLNDLYGLYQVDVGSHLRAGAENTVRWVFVNGYARQEELSLYFVDDFWRDAKWTPDGAGSSWTYSHTPDPSGDLGPMTPWLDEPIYFLHMVNDETLEHARRSQAGFSLYAPYITTQPVIVNNRFLYGLYASALGTKHSLVYAYADWGTDPWDDNEAIYSYRANGNPEARRGYGGYQLILPSWEDKVYDTVVYESLREGIEDSRIIATLKKAIAEHSGPPAQTAQAFLDIILAKPSREVHPRYWSTNASLPIDKYADRSAEILSDLADGDPNAYGVFDEIRRRMIEYIVRLNAMPPNQSTSAPANPPG